MQPAWRLLKRFARKSKEFVRPHAAQENASLETNAFRLPAAVDYTYQRPGRALLIFPHNRPPPAILDGARPLKILRLVKFAVTPQPVLLGPIASHPLQFPVRSVPGAGDRIPEPHKVACRIGSAVRTRMRVMIF
jgi:hypothetical protein